MRFTCPTLSRRLTVLPLLAAALLPAVLVLTLACMSMNGAEAIVRLPTVAVARPPVVRESPAISVQLSRQGEMNIAGRVVAAGARAAAWQCERQAMALLGFQPSQATVVIWADADMPTSAVQQVIDEAQQAGFARCVLRSTK